MPNNANANDPHLNDPRALWQHQEIVKVTITVDDVRHKAARFERRIHWRNVREYVAGVVVIGLLASRVGRFHGWRLAPLLLLIAGTLYVMFQIYRRGSTRPVPGNVGIMATLEFHRLELERQRDAAASVWRWYLLPLVPGILAVMAIGAIDHGIDARLVRGLVGFIILFVVIWKLNERAARTLDRKIQEVRAMEANDK